MEPQHLNNGKFSPLRRGFLWFLFNHFFFPNLFSHLLIFGSQLFLFPAIHSSPKLSAKQKLYLVREFGAMQITAVLGLLVITNSCFGMCQGSNTNAGGDFDFWNRISEERLAEWELEAMLAVLLERQRSSRRRFSICLAYSEASVI
ncbi:hypothetical protein GOBAR_AA29596 [Gossypium barbadense]|uniref:Uncharacterized protein n=1 Tax=Gossypium barbadense TaxID=3634 RepID=A0A2P5WJ29_GOSBA|nr:hypothetical protein GOBAR_AA29596 [Gossypium barbadense]